MQLRLVSGARQYDHITPVLIGAALASGSTSDVFQDGHPGLPVTVRHGSSHLAADFQLVFDEGRRQLSSATSRTCGTAFQVICDNLTLAFNDLYGY